MALHPVNDRQPAGVDHVGLEFVHTVEYNYVKIFGTPGCRNPSRDYSQRYRELAALGGLGLLEDTDGVDDEVRG